MTKQQKYVFVCSDMVQNEYILGQNDVERIVSVFLFKYVSLEALYKKLLIIEKEKDGKKLSDKEKRQLSVQEVEVKKVLSYFDIEFDAELVKRVFGSDDKNYMTCSIKKLRDRLVHNVNDNVLKIIVERSETMNNDIDTLKNQILRRQQW